MTGRVVAMVVIVAALAGGAWLGRDNGTIRRLTSAVGLPSSDSTPATAATLANAGVHKCRTGAGTVYLDRPCPAGAHELTPTGGTVTVMSFPKVTPVADTASAIGGGLVKGMSREDIDRLRDKQIEDAANR